ncbi:MAG TPA: GntR family transcriptional regulator [Firmicutes bacterium]|nr:GntR family transcriptional regulator [Bacillota bacterium]
MTKYETIVTDLKKAITDGKIKPGGKLPSIRKVCDQFACSKVTAVKAFDLLENEHFIYSVPQSGHYLITKPPAAASESKDNVINFATLAPDEHLLPFADLQHCLSKAFDYYKKDLFSNVYGRGLPGLIQAVGKQLQDYQVFTAEQNIMITSGTQQAINILSGMPFPNGHNNVLIEQPTYFGAIQSLEMNKVKAIGIPRTKAGINFDELERLCRDGDIKFFYIIPRFHNPGGFSYSNHEKKQILKLAEKYDLYLVEDDYLADLEVDSKADPLFALDTSGRVIYLKSYSKVVVPGLRIAAVVLPPNLTATFENYKRWSDLNTSVLSQGTLEIYIRSHLYDVHTKRLKKIYRHRMGYLKQVTGNCSCDGLQWYIPSSGLVASLKIPSPFHIEGLIKKLKNKNVLLEDTAPCFLSSYLNPRFLRLSVSRVNDGQIKRGIALIDQETKINSEGI